VKYTNFNDVFTNYDRLNYSFQGLGWILDNKIILLISFGVIFVSLVA